MNIYMNIWFNMRACRAIMHWKLCDVKRKKYMGCISRQRNMRVDTREVEHNALIAPDFDEGHTKYTLENPYKEMRGGGWWFVVM